jgi:hypothetical protein
MTSRSCLLLTLTFRIIIMQLLFGPTAPSPVGEGPAHYRGFTITLRHTTPVRTPLNERQARHRNLYLKTHNTKKTNIHAPGGVRTHNTSKQAAADPCLRSLDLCDRLIKQKRKESHFLQESYDGFTTTNTSVCRRQKRHHVRVYCSRGRKTFQF